MACEGTLCLRNCEKLSEPKLERPARDEKESYIGYAKEFWFYPTKMKYHMALKYWYKFIRVVFVFLTA